MGTLSFGTYKYVIRLTKNSVISLSLNKNEETPEKTKLPTNSLKDYKNQCISKHYWYQVTNLWCLQMVVLSKSPTYCNTTALW